MNIWQEFLHFFFLPLVLNFIVEFKDFCCFVRLKVIWKTKSVKFLFLHRICLWVEFSYSNNFATVLHFALMGIRMNKYFQNFHTNLSQFSADLLVRGLFQKSFWCSQSCCLVNNVNDSLMVNLISFSDLWGTWYLIHQWVISIRWE